MDERVGVGVEVGHVLGQDNEMDTEKWKISRKWRCDSFCLLWCFDIRTSSHFQNGDVSLVLVATVTFTQVLMPGHKGPPSKPAHVSEENWWNGPWWHISELFWDQHIYTAPNQQIVTIFSFLLWLTCERSLTMCCSEPPSSPARHPAEPRGATSGTPPPQRVLMTSTYVQVQAHGKNPKDPRIYKNDLL